MMKPVICKYTKETKSGEVTTLYIVFRSIYVGAEDKARRACGFTAYASDAPAEDCEEAEEDDDEEEDEQFIILPYGKEK